MIDIRQLSSLNLEGVTISAQINADGTLFPVEGGFNKLLAAAKDKTLPRIHTIIVHPNQKDVPVELSDPHSELRVFKAWTLEEAVQRILVDEQTRWGEIPDFREVLYRYREYVGREWLSQQVEAAKENAVSEQGPAYILITGKPGTGKSAFVAHQVSNQAGSVYHFIHRGEGNLDDPEVLLNSLIAQLRRIYAIPIRVEDHQLSAADTFHRILKQVSRKLEKGQYQTIWIDGLDEAFGPLGRFSDRSLSELIPLNGLPKGIVLVLTSRPGGEHLNWLEDPEQIFSISIDAQLKSSKDDIRAYLTVQNESLALGLKPEFLNQLVEASEGCFVAAVRYLHPNPHLKDVLAEWQLHPETIPKGLSGWLNWQWQWLLRAAREQNIPERTLIGVLGYLAVVDEKARAKVLFHFLSEKQLEEYWDRVLQLSSELVERVQARGSTDIRYRFFHPHFAEFIWEKVKQRVGQTVDVPKDEKLIERLPEKQRKRPLSKLSFNQLRIGIGIIILLAISSLFVTWQNRPGSTGNATPTIPQNTTNPVPIEIVTQTPYLSAIPTISTATTFVQEVKLPSVVISSKNISQLVEQARLGKGAAAGVSFSPNGKLLAVASGTGIWLYDAQTGEFLRLLEGHTRGVGSVAWSPDGNRLASGSGDATIRIWDPAHENELLKLIGHEGPVNSVVWSPDGKELASGSADHTVRLWDAVNGRQLYQLTGHKDNVTSVTWSPDGNKLASGSVDKTIRLWDAQTGKELSQLIGHQETVSSVAWSPDGKRLASGSDESIIRIWDTANGQEVLQIKEFKGEVTSIAWSSDGKQLASAGGDNIIHLWDADNGVELLKLEGHEQFISSISWSSDGQRIASSSADATVRIWEIASGRELRIEGFQNRVADISWPPDGQYLASCGWNKSVLIWDTVSSSKVLALSIDDQWSRSVAWSPDGKKLAAGDDGGVLRVWNMPAGDKVFESGEHHGHINAIAWSNNGRFLASVSDSEPGNTNGFLQVMDINNGDVILEKDLSPAPARSLAWSPDGSKIALGSNNPVVQILDISNGQVIRELIGHTDAIYSLAWSPVGDRLASASADGDFRIWDVTSGKELLALSGHRGVILSLAWSPDGTLLASGGRDDGTIRVWDTTNGWQLLRLDKHDGVNAIAWSPDGTRLASAGYDGTVRIWGVP